MSDGLMCITSSFEGRALSTLTYKGRPAWIAREVGAALGYSDRGKRLATKVTGDWSDEFIDGHDYAILEHSELNAIKGLQGLGTDSVPSHSPSMLILFEPGLHLALTKTNKPIGRRLRRFIVDDVLPQIVRDGAYLPERRVEDGQLVNTDGAKLDARLAREQRLARRLELEDRKFKVQTLRRTIKDIEKTISAEAITSLQVVAAEIALERDLSDLKPTLGSGWVQPSEIAKRHGVSANRVGRVISELGLRGDMPGLSKSILNKAQHGDRNVVSYLYSPTAVKQIEERLREEGQLAAVESDFN